MSGTIGIHDPKIVEAIVHEVLLRLKSDTSFMSSVSRTVSGDSKSTGSEPNQLVRIPGKVITLESLRGKLSGTNEVLVQSSAIVTPAAKDELRQLKIEIVFETTTTNAHQTKQLCVARLTDHFVSTQWLKPLGSVAVCCGDNYEQVASNLVDRLDGDGKTSVGKQGNKKLEKAVCVAAQPFVAVASLNREQQLRAAFARTEREVSEIKATLNANVLVVESNQSQSDQFKLIENFLK